MPGSRKFFARAAASGALALALLFAAPWSVPGSAQAAELVMFETLGCPWCMAWDREVGGIYHKTAEGRTAPLRRLDIGDPRPPELAALPDIVYTPTFVLMDGGREVGRIVGYPGENLFWGLLDEMFQRLPVAAGS
ncbi:MAG: thioredoxin family protein [Alphaproteobacteria bacterium]